jgi:hypothetical protein
MDDTPVIFDKHDYGGCSVLQMPNFCTIPITPVCFVTSCFAEGDSLPALTIYSKLVTNNFQTILSIHSYSELRRYGHSNQRNTF